MFTPFCESLSTQNHIASVGKGSDMQKYGKANNVQDLRDFSEELGAV